VIHCLHILLKGVVQQTVKDMNQSLVDDFLVFSDKIGSANFFWSFPSKAYQDQNVRKETLSNTRAQIRQNIDTVSSQVDEARAERNHPDRAKMLAEFANIRREEEQLDGQLEQLKVNDPDEIRRVEKLAQVNKASADRWTDNLWQIKSFLTKKKGMAGKEVSYIADCSQYFADVIVPHRIVRQADKMLHIDSAFDYVEYVPVGSKRKST